MYYSFTICVFPPVCKQLFDLESYANHRFPGVVSGNEFRLVYTSSESLFNFPCTCIMYRETVKQEYVRDDDFR